ncbi:ATP-binding protein [Solicola gregarius]|uniref:Anti-sigma factor n=1 Tax=Solicola gregarius TaxID=2908642 RepID=A0AA46TJI7_9ACTN|nr:anti-sigma factor [Solicola gregarius]UYM06019.1 anti-sigma factor [Solicola gregarius]
MPYETMPERPAAEVTLPAAGEFLTVLRTTAAALAATADFIIDDIEDLRIAIDEACSVLISRAIPGTDLHCRFFVDDGALTIEASAHVIDRRPPPRSGFAWMVLTSLTTSVDAHVREPDELVVTMTRAGSKAKAG